MDIFIVPDLAQFLNTEVVTGYLRRLPRGQKHSIKQAMLYSAITGCSPSVLDQYPDGIPRTYVSEHTRGRDGEVDILEYIKHKFLISLLERFGFACNGVKKDTGECVFSRSRQKVDYSDPYKSFPFINPDFTVSGLIPINHDWGFIVPKFEIFKDSKDQFRFRLKAGNGEIIATSEGYSSKQGCKNGIQSVKDNAPAATIVDLT